MISIMCQSASSVNAAQNASMGPIQVQKAVL